MRSVDTGAALPRLPEGLVIFDCDGVLIDSEPLSAALLSEALTAAGYPITGAEIHARFTGFTTAEMVEMLVAEDGVKNPGPIIEAWRAKLFPAFAQELQPVPGIAALLDALDRPICVASNSGVVRLDRSLGVLPIRAAFGPHVYSAEMVARPKPAPDLVHLCLERMAVSADEAVMVDDSPHGIEAAVAAGVAAIGFVTPGDTRPARERVLREAGALAVVTSAADLATLLGVPMADAAAEIHGAPNRAAAS